MCVCMREGGGYDPNHNPPPLYKLNIVHIFKSKMLRVFPFQALGYYSVVSVKIGLLYRELTIKICLIFYIRYHYKLRIF